MVLASSLPHKPFARLPNPSVADAHAHPAPSLSDEATFERLFKEHYAPLHRYAFRTVGDTDAAEEIVQATFARLWEKRHSLRIDGAPQAYLYRAVHNAALNHLEHQKVRGKHRAHLLHRGEDTAPDGAPERRARAIEARLDAALRALPEACRTVFQLSRFEELKYREIAGRLGISPKTVEAQMGKALRILRVELAEFLPLLLTILSTFLNSQP